MREKDIKFSTITADIVDPRSGVVKPATIAFSLSYEGKNPLVVQQVANVLASLYLEENIRVVQQQTTSTTKFLEEEMKEVQAKLVELEKRLLFTKKRIPVPFPNFSSTIFKPWIGQTGIMSSSMTSSVLLRRRRAICRVNWRACCLRRNF